MSIDFSGEHVSIDLETMSLASNAVILSVGMVRFDFGGTMLERRAWYPSITEQLGKGRDVSSDTMNWWVKQDAAARAVFDQPRQSVYEVLAEIADFCHMAKGVWGYGGTEDNAKMIDLGLQFGKEPWHFRKNRCGRTLIALAEGFRWPDRVGVPHNALDDAESQAHAMANAARIMVGIKP